MSNNKLLSDIGFAGDGDAVEAILAGTYEFPPDTDPHSNYCSPNQQYSSVPLVKI
jgi:hypothetical protein